MLQPFILFEKKYIPGLRNLHKRYLVTQTYLRTDSNTGGEMKTPLLLTDYNDLGQARIHSNAVKHDPYASIIDLEKPAHLSKFSDMLGVESKYLIYWAVVRDAAALKKLVDTKYKENIRRYLEKNTNWRINRNATLYPSLEVTFGELFLTLKYGSQRLRLKFEEIERS